MPAKALRAAIACAVSLAILLSIAAAAAAAFCRIEFGGIDLNNILFQIQNGLSLSFVGTRTLATAGGFLLSALACSAMVLVLLARLMKSGSTSAFLAPAAGLLSRALAPLKRLLDRPAAACLLITSVLCTASLAYVDRSLHVMRFIRKPMCDLIDTNFARLDTARPMAVKRNLIFILAESLEQGYADAGAYQANIIPQLTMLQKQGTSFAGYRRTAGSKHSMDGLLALTTGMPLIDMPFSIHDRAHKKDYGAILKNAPGIFNLLENNGYDLAYFMGTMEDFTNKDLILPVHGMKRLLGKEHWLSSGYALDAATEAVNHRFNDVFLFDRAKEYLQKLPAGRPFATVIETADTHFPDGFAEKGSPVKFGGERDAIRNASRLISGFVAWCRTQPWYADTTIVIIGDHPWQDLHFPFTQYTKLSHNRETYNVFLNTAAAGPARRVRRSEGFLPMDLAPTILDAMGADYEAVLPDGTRVKHRLGIGVSLLSDEPNLCDKFGAENVKRDLELGSALYRKLF